MNKPKGPAIAKLDGEKRRLVEDCFHRARIRPAPGEFSAFCDRIEHAMRNFIEVQQEEPARQANANLRRIFRFATSNDPPVGQIRHLLTHLAGRALRHVDRVAPLVLAGIHQPCRRWRIARPRGWLGILRQTQIERPCRRPQRPGWSSIVVEPPQLALSQRARPRKVQRPVGLVGWRSETKAPPSTEGPWLTWVKLAPPNLLLRFAMGVTSNGFNSAKGQKRPNGHRSRCHIEPRPALGAPRSDEEMSKKRRAKGGAPSDSYLDLALVGSIAYAWEVVAGAPPRLSDGSPLGELIHLVYDWMALPSHATRALRSYRESLRDDSWEGPTATRHVRRLGGSPKRV